MRRLLLVAGTLLTTASCGGGGGGLAKPDVHYRDFGINVAKRSVSYLTPENHKDGWGQSNCLICHQNFKHTMATPDMPADKYQSLINSAVEKVGINNSILVCSACHGTNGVTKTGAGQPVERKCLVCHDNFERLHFYRGTSQRKHFHDFNGNGRIDDFDCVVCHWQPDMDGIVEPYTDFGRIGGTVKRNSQDLCLTCHSKGWGSLSGEKLADTNGDGVADAKISPTQTPPDIATPWIDNWHGLNEFTAGDKPFKNIDISGELLFYTKHEALECVDCHNPHGSNNDKLIVEKVGETLTLVKAVKQVDNTAEVKYVLIDPQTTAFFKDLSYSGVVEAKGKTYDLSNSGELKAYVNLPVKNDDSSNETNRATVPSLCAACHDGTSSYSSVNNLGLPKDIATHGGDSSCVKCHSHGGGTF